MHRTIFFLLDGLPDSPRTDSPLRLAKKTNINRLLQYARLAQFTPLPGRAWPRTGAGSVSHIANLAILGYNVTRLQTARGPIEAVGSGCPYRNGWLALRCNFATIGPDGRLLDRRAGRADWGLDQLVRDLNKISFQLPFRLTRTAGHRAVLVFSQPLSDAISASDPGQINCPPLPLKPLKNDAATMTSAALVGQLLDRLHATLAIHPINRARVARGLLPANIILVREPGNRLPRLRSFLRTHRLRDGIVVAGPGAVRGTCLLAGFRAITLADHADAATHLRATFQAVSEHANDAQLTYVHIKGPDEAAHDRDCKRKQLAIEMFDRAFGRLVKKFGRDDYTYALSADHRTNCRLGQHQPGSVPLLVISNQSQPKPPVEFSELAARTRIRDPWTVILDHQ